jgi:hypothetical protein
MAVSPAVDTLEEHLALELLEVMAVLRALAVVAALRLRRYSDGLTLAVSEVRVMGHPSAEPSRYMVEEAVVGLLVLVVLAHPASTEEAAVAVHLRPRRQEFPALVLAVVAVGFSLDMLALWVVTASSSSAIEYPNASFRTNLLR